MNPSLLEFPDHFDTERITIRAPRAGDGTELNAAIVESLAELRPWMPWAQTAPSLEDSEVNIRKAAAQFQTREDLRLMLFLRGSPTLVGSSGLHRINWSVPCFEIGYWIRSSCCGQGYATEAVRGILAFAREHLHPRRVEIRMAEANVRSWRVAERAGFPLEATLHNDRRLSDGSVSHTRIYAHVF